MNLNRFIPAVAATILLTATSAQAQDKKESNTPEYQFTTVKEVPISSIKNQFRSGTCWSYSGIGFIESEIMLSLIHI